MWSMSSKSIIVDSPHHSAQFGNMAQDRIPVLEYSHRFVRGVDYGFALLRSSFKGIVMSMYSSSAASMPLTSHDFCMRPAYLHIHPHVVDFATPYSLQMFFSAFPADAVSQDRS